MVTSAREQSSYPWQQPPDPHQQPQTFHLSGKCSQDVWVSQVRWCKRAKLVLSTWFFSREVRRGIGGRERERAPQQMCVVLSHSVKSDSSRSHGLNSQGSSVHVDFPGKNTGVGWHALSKGSSQSRDQTQVSHIAGKYFTIWATRKAQESWSG